MKALEKDSVPYIRASLLLGPHYFFVVLAQQIRAILLALPPAFFSLLLPHQIPLCGGGYSLCFLNNVIEFLMFKMAC
jgi:hypothetical protein